ncbi:hypothetical protein ACO0RG_001327 [Hanseniaspora osmophila]|uniref:Uncharacterized protein n=1 Tax=Hanseniaspora osmophila TaxID=56408 RepID=A0A1E5RNJ7_9ASCO|nr:hypothetical protein AWRI3579_g958 [Hanseniaspora osmophila]
MAISKLFKKTFNLIYTSTTGESLSIQEAPEQPFVSTNTTAVGPSTKLNTKGFEAFDRSFNDKKFFKAFHIEHKNAKDGDSKTTSKPSKSSRLAKKNTNSKEQKAKNTDPKAPNNSLTYIYLISEHLEKYKSSSQEHKGLSRGSSCDSVLSGSTQEEIIISALTSNQRKAEEHLKKRETNSSSGSSDLIIGITNKSTNNNINNNNNHINSDSDSDTDRSTKKNIDIFHKIKKIDPILVEPINIVDIGNHKIPGKEQKKETNQQFNQPSKKNMNERIVKILNLEKEKQDMEESSEGENRHKDTAEDGVCAVDHLANSLDHQTSDALKKARMKTIKGTYYIFFPPKKIFWRSINR